VWGWLSGVLCPFEVYPLTISIHLQSRVPLNSGCRHGMTEGSGAMAVLAIIIILNIFFCFRHGNRTVNIHRFNVLLPTMIIMIILGSVQMSCFWPLGAPLEITFDTISLSVRASVFSGTRSLLFPCSFLAPGLEETFHQGVPVKRSGVHSHSYCQGTLLLRHFSRHQI
jgi:hypothetical protein